MTDVAPSSLESNANTSRTAEGSLAKLSSDADSLVLTAQVVVVPSPQAHSGSGIYITSHSQE